MVRRTLLMVLAAVVVLSCTGPEPAPPEPVESGPPLTTVRPDGDAAGAEESPEPPGATEDEGPEEVVLDVGDDFQAIIDAHEPGTRYRIAAGVHRLQQIVPHDGDTFTGESGAVLSGARDISDGVAEWDSEGQHWYLDDQTQEGEARGQIRDGGRERDLHPEDLFVDGERYVHVGQRDALDPGTYFFDYAEDRIWLAENPGTLGLIETSVAPFAFSGEQVSGVTIDNLVIERYASPAQHGVVGGRRVYDWTLRRLTVRHNHGGGIRVGPGMTVEDSSVVDNGQIGIVGTGLDDETGYTAPVVIRHNEIARNLVLDYDPTWEGGGTKFARTHAGIVVEDNWIHDNHGHGLWFDLHAYDASARGNLIESNEWIGIFYEISHGPHPQLGGSDAQIVANEVRGNGHGAQDTRRGAAIFVSNSEDVEVAENWLHDNYGGIVLRQAPDREADTARVRVRDNDLSYDSGCTGFLLDGYRSGEQEEYVRDADVTFSDNRYGDVPPAPFCWIAEGLDFDDWTELGHDVDTAGGGASVPESHPAANGHLAEASYGAA